jgi:O-antigen ligase
VFRAFRQITLFLVGFTLPIQGYSLLDFAFGLTPSKLATAVLLMLAVVQFGLSGRWPPPDGKRVWLLVFTLSYGISSVVGLLGGVNVAELLIAGSTQLALILYYLLIGYVVQNRRELALVLWALVIGGAVTSAPALLGIQTSTAAFEYGRRASGLAGQENLLGFDMAVCVPLGVALFFAARSLLARTVLLGLTTACLVGLLLSLSRSAMVSGAVMAAFWIWRSGRIENLRYLLPAVAVVAGVLLFSPESVVRRLETMIDPSQRAADRSIQSRFVQYQWAAKAFASNPAVGIGVQRFVPWVREQPGGSTMHHEIHNAYLAVAARQGLLGAIPFLAILLMTWTQYARAIRLVRARRRLHDRELAGLGHLASFLQIALLGGLVGALFGMAHNSKTLWLVLGLSPALVALSRARITQLEQAGAPLPEPEATGLPAPMPAHPAGTSG